MRVLLPLKAKQQQQRTDENHPAAEENLPLSVARASALGANSDSSENETLEKGGDWLRNQKRRRGGIPAEEEDSEQSLSKRLCRELDLDLNRKPAAKPTAQRRPPQNLDRKLPAKMTAGRYADEEREPPPPEENDPAAAHGFITNTRNNPASDCDQDDTREHIPVSDTAPDSSFAQALKKRGLEILPQEGDGNCLFRAVSLQVYGSADMHAQVRKQCLDHMAKDEEHFRHFVTGEAFGDYIARKRQDGVHGNNPEIQAISELFNRPVEVYTPDQGAAPLNIFQTEYKTADVPIRLSYHDGSHYNAVVDPLCPTAGLGLGLPNLQPGLADQLQVAKAVQESEHQMADQLLLNQAIEDSNSDNIARALKESAFSAARAQSDQAMALSDIDATNFELEQAILESSMMDGQMQGKQGSFNRDQSRSSSLPLPAASVPPAAASVPVAASLHGDDDSEDEITRPSGLRAGEYPQVVQELAMNGFELQKVVRAYELIGDSFDDLLSFLVSTSSSS